jgi:hypothetical protein
VELRKAGALLHDGLDATFEAAAPDGSAAAQALLLDTPFPRGPLKLGALSAAVKGGGALSFGSGPSPVTFGLGAGLRAGLGVYDDDASLRADLDPRGERLAGLDLPRTGVARFVALEWGYELSAGAAGPGVALGAAGRATLAADGRSRGRLLVLRAFRDDPGARTAVQSVLDALRLPRQVQSADDLGPGTWLVAEVDGSVAAKLGVTFGYDVDWTRRVGLGALSGSVGLKVHAGLSGSLGLRAQGRFHLTVAREALDPGARVVRVRLARRRERAQDAALHGGVDLTPSTGTLLPDDAAQFVAGVFGLHGAQLIADLASFRGWLDSTQAAPERFTGFLAELAGRHLGGLALDALADARARVASLIAAWDRLPAAAAGLVWGELRRGGDGIAALEALLRALDRDDDDALRAEVERQLARAGFLGTLAGRWLEAALDGGALGALAPEAAAVRRRLRDHARATLALLDGTTLAALARFVEERLGLGVVRSLSGPTALATVEPWLRARLEALIGGALDAPALDALREALAALDRQAQTLYVSARRALNRAYGFALDVAWSRAGVDSALVDAEFDFGLAPPPAGALAAALAGEWGALFGDDAPGLRLRQAQLTHGFERRRQVQVTLPWFSGSFSDLSRSLARLSVIDEGGRLMLLEVEAEDEAGRAGRWRSRLSLRGRLALPGVRDFDAGRVPPGELSVAYGFRLALDDAGPVDLERTLAPLAELYFEAGGAAPAEGMAALMPAAAAERPGRLALALDVAVSPAVAEAWLAAQPDPRDAAYMRLSRAVQRALRRVIPACYFQDPARYAGAERAVAAQVVAWSCLPVSTAIALDGRRLARVDLDHDVFWDPTSSDERSAMLSSPATRLVLGQRMADVRARLLARPDLRAFASDWAEGREDELLQAAFAGPGELLVRLLRCERACAREAREAGLGLARVRQAAAFDPEAALRDLAAFGARLTGAFHDALALPFAGQGPNLRAFAALVFFDGARALLAQAAPRPRARLELARVAAGAPADWARRHIEGAALAAAEIQDVSAVMSRAD